MEEVDLLYGNLVYFTDISYAYFMAIWYICWLFGIFSPVLVSISEKSLATLYVPLRCYVFNRMQKLLAHLVEKHFRLNTIFLKLRQLFVLEEDKQKSFVKQYKLSFAYNTSDVEGKTMEIQNLTWKEHELNQDG
jgi:hypothetical protein